MWPTSFPQLYRLSFREIILLGLLLRLPIINFKPVFFGGEDTYKSLDDYLLAESKYC